MAVKADATLSFTLLAATLLRAAVSVAATDLGCASLLLLSVAVAGAAAVALLRDRRVVRLLTPAVARFDLPLRTLATPTVKALLVVEVDAMDTRVGEAAGSSTKGVMAAPAAAAGAGEPAGCIAVRRCFLRAAVEGAAAAVAAAAAVGAASAAAARFLSFSLW